jgi:serine phosphatase RsbU (regulator of sigma subunit)
MPPAVVRSSGGSIDLKEGGMVAGLFPDAAYHSGFIQLHPGDIVVGCTDGITEAADAQENEYGRERLVRAARRQRSASAQQIVETILDDVDNFSGGGVQNDDRVLLVLKVL